MKRILVGSVAVLAFVMGPTTSCSSSEPNNVSPSGDGGANDGTTNCGRSGEPCCNGTACNAGLTCGAGTCASSNEAGDDVATDAAAVRDGVADSGEETLADAGGNSNVPDAAGDTAIADAGADSNTNDAPDAGCSFGILSCDGQQPTICTGSGTLSNLGAPCSGGTPVCLNGACVVCSPGATQCSGNGLETCSGSGMWVVASPQPTTDAGAEPDPRCAIDYMTGPSTVTGGYWYTYSDRTIPNSIILVPNPAGIISPLEGAQFPPDMDGTAGPMVPGVAGLANFREFTGGGLTLWGAGMGFDWHDLVPPSDDAGDDAAAALGVPAAFDATGHTGISFYAKSNTGKNQAASVHFSDSREAPAGGMCNPDAAIVVFDGGADTVNSPTECSDDFFKAITITPNWTNITIKFSATATQNFSGMNLKALDITKLYQVHFQVNNPGYAGKGPIAPQPAWDYSIAYVTWYDGP